MSSRSVSKNILLDACGPLKWQRNNSSTGIWSNAVFAFYDFPAFYCGTPQETITFLRDIPTDSFTDQKILRRYLANYLAFIPQANLPGKLRFIDKDGWFYSDTLRKQLINEGQLILAFNQASEPKHPPKDCALKVIDPKHFGSLILAWLENYQVYSSNHNYYFFCKAS